ncbi:hypothetical protein D3C81_1480380 [compost metagenome]
MHAGAANHRGERHGAARRMQTAQGKHGADGQAGGQRRHAHAGPQPFDASHADQAGDHIAAHHGPRLRQRAGRQAEQQHGRGAHGRDQVDAGAVGGQQEMADESSEQQAADGASAGAQLFAAAAVVRLRQPACQERSRHGGGRVRAALLSVSPILSHAFHFAACGHQSSAQTACKPCCASKFLAAAMAEGAGLLLAQA